MLFVLSESKTMNMSNILKIKPAHTGELDVRIEQKRAF
jgi:hypothetical protein